MMLFRSSFVLPVILVPVLFGASLPTVESAYDNYMFASASRNAVRDSVIHPARLTVKPKTDATGETTLTAGLTELAGFPGYYLYVPKQCVGKKRSPLVLHLHGAGGSARKEVNNLRSLADKYGIILLAGNASAKSFWGIRSPNGQPVILTNDHKDTNHGIKAVNYTAPDVAILDSALKLVLRTNAIDPEKLALLGFSNGGAYTLFLGRSNLDVFSRIVALSPIPVFDGEGPANPKTQFFISGGIGEEGLPYEAVKLAQVLRKQGHSVLTQIGLRGHIDHVYDEDLIWEWLEKSWKNPKITTQIPTTAPEVLLTAEAVAKLTTFWKQFRLQPDSIQTDGRIANQKHTPMMLGAERVLVVLMDIPAMAGKYSSIAAELKAAGLTAKEAEAYRTALLSVTIAKLVGVVPGEQTKQTQLGKDIPLAPVKKGSVLARNIDFVNANKDKLKELKTAGFWKIQ